MTAWLLGKVLARGPEPVDPDQFSGIGFWVAIVATAVNYARYFRFHLGTADSTVERRKLLSDDPGRAAFALTAFLGPAAIIVIVVLLGPDST